MRTSTSAITRPGSPSWAAAHAIGQRPLLLLGVLLVLVGVQLLMFGLLAELMISRDRDIPQPMLVRERSGASTPMRDDAPLGETV